MKKLALTAASVLLVAGMTSVGLGDRASAAEQRFICPCHSSAFDIRGDVVNPPAPRALA